MSKHNIHGINVNITVSQGNMTDVARGRCVGKVVNLLRSWDADKFQQFMADSAESLQGTAFSAACLSEIDSALAENYTPRTTDDFAPIANINAA